MSGAVLSPVASPPPRRLSPTRPPPSGRPTRDLVTPQRTPLRPGRLRLALERAYQTRHGERAPAALIDVLTAHVRHETADGRQVYNHNFGGIKGASPEGQTARLKTTEVLQGRRRRVRDGFRAYATPERGAEDYLGFLERNHPAAMADARRGDISGFARHLKRGGYYTAPVATYAASMARRYRAATPTASDATEAPPWVDDGRLAEAVRAETRPYLYGEELAAEARRLDADADALPPDVDVDVARVLSAASSLAARIGVPAGEEDHEEGTAS
ncbi:MAG: glucosaminidase domain-containing protein [Myxococcota bacterium]